MKKEKVNIKTDDDTLQRVAEFFKVFGDKGRLSILYALFDKELYVNEIAEITKISPSLVSHQLRVLRQNHLVRYQKKGKLSIYRLDDDHVSSMIKTAYGHLEHRGEINDK